MWGFQTESLAVARGEWEVKAQNLTPCKRTGEPEGEERGEREHTLHTLFPNCRDFLRKDGLEGELCKPARDLTLSVEGAIWVAPGRIVVQMHRSVDLGSLWGCVGPCGVDPA